MARSRLDLVLRLYMAATGENQQAVADQLGITSSMLSYLMDGKRGPSDALRKRLADWLLATSTVGEDPSVR